MMLFGLSRASGFTTSFAPITTATSVDGNSGLITSNSWSCEYGTLASANKTFMCPGIRSSRSRSEEHTSELQSHLNLVCRLLLEKKRMHMRRESDHHEDLRY